MVLYGNWSPAVTDILKVLRARCRLTLRTSGLKCYRIASIPCGPGLLPKTVVLHANTNNGTAGLAALALLPVVSCRRPGLVLRDVGDRAWRSFALPSPETVRLLGVSREHHCIAIVVPRRFYVCFCNLKLMYFAIPESTQGTL